MSYFSSVNIFDPHTGKHSRNTPVGAVLVDQSTRLTGTMFQTAVDPQFWTVANAGAASAAGVANYIATLTSGTGNNGYGSITTMRQARFMFANPNYYRAAVRLPALGGPQTTRQWGAMNLVAGAPPTISDGFFFSYDGNGSTLSVNNTAGGVNTSVASGSFNGDQTTYVIDANVHAYEILYFVMGAWFFIDDVFVHHVAPTTGMLAQKFTLNASAVAKNSVTGVTSESLEIWSASILRFGKEFSRPKSVTITTNTTTVCKLGAGTLHRVILNTPGSAANSISIYDNTIVAGTPIAVIASNIQAIEFNYEFDFYTGLTVVTAAGTPANMTVVYD